jgi:hypothetical protein
LSGGAECTDRCAHNDQHNQPVAGMDRQSRTALARIAVIDRHRGEDEAEPDKRTRHDAIGNRHLARAEMTEQPGNYQAVLASSAMAAATTRAR